MKQIDHPRYEQHRSQLEGALSLAAADLSAHVSIASDPANAEYAFGGLMVAFRPAIEGQKWLCGRNPNDRHDWGQASSL